jgi:Putative prokaryotic signal transducing protein
LIVGESTAAESHGGKLGCSMYCPECRAEYRPGFTECSDCRVSLVAGAPPLKAAALFDPTLEAVVVLETNDPIQSALAKGLLEDAEIPFFVLGQVARLVASVDPFLHKWVRIQVPQARAEEARELLGSLLHPRPYLCD